MKEIKIKLHFVSWPALYIETDTVRVSVCVCVCVNVPNLGRPINHHLNFVDSLLADGSLIVCSMDYRQYKYLDLDPVWTLLRL